MRHVPHEPEEQGCLSDLLDAVHESDWNAVRPCEEGKTPCAEHDWIEAVEDAAGELVARRACSVCGAEQDCSLTDLLWAEAMSDGDHAA